MAGLLALIAGWILLLVLAVAGLVAGGLATRRILLARAGGTVECGLRGEQAAAWRLGLVAYRPDQLWWFSAFGFRLRPQEAFDRRGLRVLARRPAAPSEAHSIGSGTVVIECQVPAPGTGAAAGPEVAPRKVELAMSENALTGFLAWLESAPPGHVSGLS